VKDAGAVYRCRFSNDSGANGTELRPAWPGHRDMTSTTSRSPSRLPVHCSYSSWRRLARPGNILLLCVIVLTIAERAWNDLISCRLISDCQLSSSSEFNRNLPPFFLDFQRVYNHFRRANVPLQNAQPRTLRPTQNFPGSGIPLKHRRGAVRSFTSWGISGQPRHRQQRPDHSLKRSRMSVPALGKSSNSISTMETGPSGYPILGSLPSLSATDDRASFCRRFGEWG
jgi:hypothetical protein